MSTISIGMRVVILALVLHLLMALTAPPVLRLAVTPNVGFPPLKVSARVRQDIERLRGYEVCLMIAGPIVVERSCWQTDIPVPLVTRELKLMVAGAYELWAASRVGESNRVRVEVVEVGQ